LATREFLIVVVVIVVTTRVYRVQTVSVPETLMVRRLMAYMVAFIIVWLPSTLNRAIDPESFILTCLHAAINPARGFFDFLACLYLWYTRRMDDVCGSSRMILGVDDDDASHYNIHPLKKKSVSRMREQESGDSL
jgi:hypothetical protein